MIKGLYFKLNIDKEKDKTIYEFFKEAPKYLKTNKIDLLYSLCKQFNENMDECLNVLMEDEKE